MCTNKRAQPPSVRAGLASETNKEVFPCGSKESLPVRAGFFKFSVILTMACILASFSQAACAKENKVEAKPETINKTEEMRDWGHMALGLGQRAGNLAGQASVAAFVTTVNTVSLLGTAVTSSVKTLKGLGTGLRPETNTPVQDTTTIAGYSPAETQITCSGCGQRTLVRGNMPGKKISCPSCGKPLTS